MYFKQNFIRNETKHTFKWIKLNGQLFDQVFHFNTHKNFSFIMFRTVLCIDAHLHLDYN